MYEILATARFQKKTSSYMLDMGNSNLNSHSFHILLKLKI